jgi:hypothetical protein
MNINYTKIALVVSAIALLSWFMAILILPGVMPKTLADFSHPSVILRHT